MQYLNGIKDSENVKRRLDEADNMIMIMEDSVRRGLKIDPAEATNRFNEIRRRIQFAIDRIQ
jgi:hypothetical protein